MVSTKNFINPLIFLYKKSISILLTANKYIYFYTNKNYLKLNLSLNNYL
jgi:hypothetical protein